MSKSEDHNFTIDVRRVFMAVSMDDHAGRTNSAGDEYKLVIETLEGERLTVNGEQTARLELVIRGHYELADFFAAIATLKRLEPDVSAA